MERKAISVRNKKSFPSGDPQQKKVYSLDSKFEKMIKNHNDIKNKKELNQSEYLTWADQVFNDEGFSDIKVKANGSNTVSQVNIDKQWVTFSNISIKKNDFETILHELAHGICKYHYGYSYKDGHNELFVNILIDTINEKLDIKKSEMYQLADEENVKYFFDLNIKKTKLNKNTYENMLKSFDKQEPIYSKKSLKKSFESHTFLKNDSIACTFFKNNNDFYLYTERLLFDFEKDLFVNPFLNNRKIKNYIIVSPFMKVFKDGSISKNGKYFSYSYTNFEKAKRNDSSIQLFQIKESASLDKDKLIKRHKNNGFIIIKPQSIEQYLSIRKFYQETINKMFA